MGSTNLTLSARWPSSRQLVKERRIRLFSLERNVCKILYLQTDDAPMAFVCFLFNYSSQIQIFNPYFFVSTPSFDFDLTFFPLVSRSWHLFPAFSSTKSVEKLLHAILVDFDFTASPAWIVLSSARPSGVILHQNMARPRFGRTLKCPHFGKYVHPPSSSWRVFR